MADLTDSKAQPVEHEEPFNIAGGQTLKSGPTSNRIIIPRPAEGGTVTLQWLGPDGPEDWIDYRLFTVFDFYPVPANFFGWFRMQYSSGSRGYII